MSGVTSIRAASGEQRFVTFPYLQRRLAPDGEQVLLFNPWGRRPVSVPRSINPLLERLVTPHTGRQIARAIDGSIEAMQPLLEAGIVVREDELLRLRRARRPVQVGLVTTVREPGPELLSFLRYHLAIGVARVFVFFDDPGDPDLPVARRFSRVTAVPVDAEVRASWRRLELYPEMGPHVRTEVAARQNLNAELAVRMARRLGLDWLLHLDDDELFHAPEGVEAYFGGIPDEVGLISFANHEAAPVRVDVDDRFRRVQLFKKNPVLLDADQAAAVAASGRRSYFNAYCHGKSAVRVGPGVVPQTVHGFRPPRSHPLMVGMVTHPSVLHYVNGSFSAYARKYRLRGRFADCWFGRVDWRKDARFTFHVESRDRLAAGGARSLEDFYRDWCVFSDPRERRRLGAAGVLLRIAGPSRRLARLGGGR